LPGGDLDEEAEHVVVLARERLGAGHFRIAPLERGDHLAAAIAQIAVFVEFGADALAHEAAVAGVQRQLLVKRGGDALGQSAIVRAQGLRGLGQVMRQVDQPTLALQRFRKTMGTRDRKSDGGEIPRAAAADRDAAERAADIRRLSQDLAQGPPLHAVGMQPLDRIETMVDALGIGQRRGQPGGELAGAGAGDRAVDDG